MAGSIFGKKVLVGGALVGVALVAALTADGSAQGDAAVAGSERPSLAVGDPPQAAARPAGPSAQGEAGQALAGLAQIRQRQCQMGNQAACQAVPEFPRHQQRLAQLEQTCRSGDRGACGEYDSFAQQIVRSYRESAAVMQSGDAGAAQMDAWRGQMNRNADASMANLQAMGAAGRAAQRAREDSYAAMTRGWQGQEAAGERTQGRFLDYVHEGTTMDGGGVQSRVPYGSTGYTDGDGRVVAVQNGGRAPDGWQEMTPTYAEPR